MPMNSSVRNRLSRMEPEVTAPTVAPVAPGDHTFDDPSDPRITPVVAPVVASSEPVVAPSDQVVAPTDALPELRYEYQPTDIAGAKLGGKQVIVYHTPDELAQKLTAQNIELVRKLREVTRKQTLGIADDTPLPDDAQRFESFVEFKPRELSTEERFNLSQDLNDPSKSLEAIDTMFEASVGMKPDVLRQTLNNQQLLMLQLTAKSNYDIFEKQTPEFYPCAENKQVLTAWMFKKKLNPTVAMFNLAFSTLKGAGLLLDSPIVREVTPAPVPSAPTVGPTAPAPSTEPKVSPVPVATESRITPVEQPQTKRQVRVPSGLNSSNASDSTTSGVTTDITLDDIDNMPSEEYKKKLRNPAFAKLVNDLQRAADARKRAPVSA
jgi:hypothetical protein